MQTFMRSAGAFALAILTFTTAQAQSAAGYPNKPVHLVVPFAAGGGNDAVARVLGEAMSRLMGQPVIIENRAGAGGNIGTDYVAKSPADGYTLVHVSNAVVVNPYLYKSLPFDVQGDLVPVGLIATAPMFILAHPSEPVSTLSDLVQKIRQGGSKLSYATPGNGTPHHFAMELLASRLGTRMVHVPYRGAGLALNDVLGGQVPLLISTSQSATDFVNAGRLKVIATTDLNRSEPFKEAPAIAELVPGFSVSIWHGLMAPARTSPAVLAALSDALSKALANTELQRKLKVIGFNGKFESPAAMKLRIAADLETWKQVAQTAGITPE